MVEIGGLAVGIIVSAFKIGVIEMEKAGETVLQGLQLGNNRLSGLPAGAVVAVKTGRCVRGAFGRHIH